MAPTKRKPPRKPRTPAPGRRPGRGARSPRGNPEARPPRDQREGGPTFPADLGGMAAPVGEPAGGGGGGGPRPRVLVVHFPDLDRFGQQLIEAATGVPAGGDLGLARIARLPDDENLALAFEVVANVQEQLQAVLAVLVEGDPDDQAGASLIGAGEALDRAAALAERGE